MPLATKGTDEVYCSSCGAVIKKDAEICPKCGVRQKGTSVVIGRRIAASLLAIFLGTFGVHKFYLNQPGMGILYLCFFWTCIPSVIALIEGIIYLTKTDEEFEKQYGKG